MLGLARDTRQMRAFTQSMVMHKHTARPTDRPSITGLLCVQGREEFLIIARRPADLVEYHNVTMPSITATDLGDRCLTEQ
jgi:hypothetical protein